MLLLMMSLVTDEQKDLLESLFREKRTLFLYIANRVLHNHQAAEDAVSDAMIKITQNFSKISRFKCPEMHAYCVVIVENCAKSMLRKEGRLIHTDDIGLFADDEAADPAAIIEDKSRQETVRRILGTLPDHDRRILLMRYAEGASYAQIATILGIKEDTARKRAERALAKLRAGVEKESV